mmetsp:Transcript_4314/g.6459  ORF Transcript_4314/g.6459 Transcript_4314/m.6459 type:complete len:254 (-) Transcript_4314:1199-1960(-)
MLRDKYREKCALIFIGMAGSGKSSTVFSLSKYFQLTKTSHYIINLDPNCRFIPFISNIDIRDSINFKQVMTEFNLGPNSAIVVAINLFITQFDQVILNCLKFKYKTIKYVLIDTPGQIEIFLWSISGFIIANLVKYALKTFLIYVLDTKKCNNLKILVSNLLVCTFILFKTKTRLIIISNKIDLVSANTMVLSLNYFNTNYIQELPETNYSLDLIRDISDSVLYNIYKFCAVINMSSLYNHGINELTSFIFLN